jgi:hypothetical protein
MKSMNSFLIVSCVLLCVAVENYSCWKLTYHLPLTLPWFKDGKSPSTDQTPSSELRTLPEDGTHKRVPSNVSNAEWFENTKLRFADDLASNHSSVVKFRLSLSY